MDDISATFVLPEGWSAIRLWPSVDAMILPACASVFTSRL